jgi:antitoxin (DNA-binding transcriptional repressor) of toxin-antitoxin stability system
MAKSTGRRTVSATEAAKNFGRLVDRVREEEATYYVERGGTPVARISPVSRPLATIGDLKGLLWGRTSVDEAYLRAVEDVVDRHNRPRVRRNPWRR